MHYLLVVCIFLFLCNLILMSKDGVCGHEDGDNDTKAPFDSGVKYEDLGFQNDLVKEMSKAGVPFYVDEEGVINYPSCFQDIIDKITNKLHNRPSVTIRDTKYAKMFIIQLREKGIDFRRKHLKGNNGVRIIWHEKDNDLVREIRENLLKRLLTPDVVTE